MGEISALGYVGFEATELQAWRTIATDVIGPQRGETLIDLGRHSWRRVDKVPHKTLLIYGRDDRVVPWDTALLLLRLMPSADLRFLTLRLLGAVGTRGRVQQHYDALPYRSRKLKRNGARRQDRRRSFAKVDISTNTTLT